MRLKESKSKIKVKFALKERDIWLEAYVRPVSDYLFAFNKNKAIIKEVKELPVPKHLKKLDPLAFEHLLGRNLVLAIKATKKK